MKPSRRDAAANRCRILDIARRLFREFGAESVSMHQIAKNAGIGQGTLYRHYAHKGELCLDLLQESSEKFLLDMEKWVRDSLDHKSCLEILDGILGRIVDFTDDNTHNLAVMVSCFEDVDAPLENPVVKRVQHLIYEVLETGVKCEEIADLDVQFTTDSILAAMSPVHYHRARHTQGYSKEQILSGFRRIYIIGLSMKPHTP